MKRKPLTHCPNDGTKLERAIQHTRWYGIMKKILHCPHCKTIFVKNVQGHVDDETLVHILKMAAFILGVLLILKGLLGCTPYY